MKRFLALTLCILLLAGCANVRTNDPTPPRQDEVEPTPTPPSEPEQVAPIKDATLTLAYDPNDVFNPYLAESSVNVTLGKLLYEGLYAVSPEGEAVPRLATDCDISADGMTYTIHLREDVLMHDGRPMTVADVMASLNFARESERYAYRLRHITSVVSVAQNSVTILLDTAYERLPLLLDVPILRAKEVEEATPTGTGPYRLVAGALRENPNWWRSDDAPYGRSVKLYAASSAVELADSFAADTINLVSIDPNGSAAPTYHSDDSLYASPTMTMQYLGFRVEEGIFANEALRAAMTYLIDRETLVSDTCGGFADEASLPASPALGNYDRGLAAKYQYDPAAFRAAMEEAGLKDLTGDGVIDIPTAEGSIPVTGTMLVCAAYGQRVQAANALAETFRAYGIDLTVQALGMSAYKRALQNGNFDVYYGETTLSPDGDLSVFFDMYGALALGGLADAVTLQLCLASLENAGNYYTLCQAIMDEGLILPVLFKQNAVYARQELGLTLTPAPGDPLYLTLEE